MTTELIYLDEPQPLEVRSEEAREIVGRIIPYGETIQVRGRPESFTMGALAGVDASKVKLLMHHDQKRPVGKMVGLEERSDGAYGVFRVSKTQAGNDALEEAKDGLLSFSPGFFAGTQSAGGVHTRVKDMPEVSLVTFSAYSGSQVLAVRDKEGEMPEEHVEETIETRDAGGADGAVDVSALETRMAEMTQMFQRLEVRLEGGGASLQDIAPSPFDWFLAKVEGMHGSAGTKYQTRFEEKWDQFQTRALEDITGTVGGSNDVSGWMQETYMASELVSILDARRPLAARLTRLPMPKSGVIRFPRVSQHTEVSARGAQKSEAPSQKMIVVTDTATHGWLAGAVDIALEAIATGEVDVLEQVWIDLIKQYARATELDPTHGVVPKIEAGGLGFTYTGSALLDGNPTYTEFITALLTAADAYEDAADEVATKLAVTRTQYNTLLAMVDSAGRRVFASSNGQNSDGSANLLSNSFTIDGTSLEVFKVKGLTQALLFGPEALKFADSGPQRVEALNVSLMGHDLGVLGRTIFVDKIPAAVQVFGTDPVS